MALARWKSGLYVGGGLCVGYLARKSYQRQQELHLPEGYPRSCCDHGIGSLDSLQAKDHRLFDPKSSPSSCLHNLPSYQLSSCESPNLTNLIQHLRTLSGNENVLLPSEANVTPYTKGVRIGHGNAEIIFRPGTLKEAVAGLKLCVAADVIVIPQGRNTGLTGGSVPRDDSNSPRSAVIFNMTRLQQIRHLDNDQMLCFAGVGIHDLSVAATRLNRESHSVLGSIFLNPTVAAGVAFGSGGTQMRKGPAYTERALWCRINEHGEVVLENTLGIACHRSSSSSPSSSSEDELLSLLDDQTSLIDNIDTQVPASCSKKYSEQLCEINDQVSRFNADLSGIDPCRSEGKVLILASIHDTFPLPVRKKSYWISCSSLEEAYRVRNEVLLESSDDLPISCEYMNRDSYEVIDTCGRVLCYCLSSIGINERLFQLWKLKQFIESLDRIPFVKTLPDQLLYLLNPLLPAYLPPHIHSLHQNYPHHLLLTLGDYHPPPLDSLSSSSTTTTMTMTTIERVEQKLSSLQKKINTLVITGPGGGEGPRSGITICELSKPSDVQRVNNFRFVAALAFKVWCVGRGVHGLSIDYTQRKNDTTEPSILPPAVPSPQQVRPLIRMRYSHFGCNVIHEDIGFDLTHTTLVGEETSSAMARRTSRLGAIEQYKKHLKHSIERAGGRLPAEHGHGTEYAAPPEMQERWRRMDPLNVMNPGIGGLSAERGYGNNS
jgi:D-lactate dehydrogenase (quinone)